LFTVNFIDNFFYFFLIFLSFLLDKFVYMDDIIYIKTKGERRI
jgi:hypothetical protein